MSVQIAAFVQNRGQGNQRCGFAAQNTGPHGAYCEAHAACQLGFLGGEAPFGPCDDGGIGTRQSGTNGLLHGDAVTCFVHEQLQCALTCFLQHLLIAVDVAHGGDDAAA